MRLYCPDYGALPDGNGFRPMFTLYKDEPMKVITFPKGERPVFPTRHAAREAAKDWFAAHCNGHIRAEVMTEPSDLLGIEQWRQERAEAIEQERARLFGSAAPSMVFPGKGRAVVVERRRRA